MSLVSQKVCLDVLQEFSRTREVREFLSGALAGAMTKAVLAPLETIRLVLLFYQLFKIISLVIAFDTLCLYKHISLHAGVNL